MKLFKKISALIAAVSIFGATVLANDLSFDNKLEYAADATKVTVNVYTTQASVGAYSTLGVEYNNEVYTLNIGECTSQGTGIEFDKATYENVITWSAPNGISAVAEGALFTLVFDVNSGKSPVGTVFSVTEQCGDTSWIFNSAEEDYVYENVSITVTSAAPAGPSAGDVKVPATTISGNKKYSVVYDKDVNERVVLEENIGAAAATAASVLVVNYLGDTKVANIYELLGISGEGSVDFASFTVKMVLPVGAAQTDNFSFNIQ